MKLTAVLAAASAIFVASSAMATQSVQFRCMAQGNPFAYAVTGNMIYGSEGAAQIVNGTAQVFNRARGNAVSARFVLAETDACTAPRVCYRSVGNANLMVSFDRGDFPANVTVWHATAGTWQSFHCGTVRQ